MRKRLLWIVLCMVACGGSSGRDGGAVLTDQDAPSGEETIEDPGQDPVSPLDHTTLDRLDDGDALDLFAGATEELAEPGDVALESPEVEILVTDAHIETVEPLAALCRPCLTGDDCGPNLLCAGMDGYWYCLMRCEAGCPVDTVCEADVCVPGSRTCGCPSEDATGHCEISNEFGTCQGKFGCTGGVRGGCTAPVPQAEVCDGVDNDCNGKTDEGVKQTFYADQDHDGFGKTTFMSVSCAAPEGFVSVAGDCDDADPTVFPGAPELCDEKDNDCNGQTDEFMKLTFYADADGDGFGDPKLSWTSCTAPDGFVEDASDCDDLDEHTNPAAPEVCNGRDDNCDGIYDDVDADSDGILAAECGGGDCDDADPMVGPGQKEQCNGKDDDCNGKTDDLDEDGDGFSPVGCGGEDCDDLDPQVSPSAVEVCNGKDDDCNGETDESDPTKDFMNDPYNCGACGRRCGEGGLGYDCVMGDCGSLPVRQHRWRSVALLDAADGWVKVPDASAKVVTRGGPLEIELSIPLVGGGHSACRPTVDGKWAGAFEALPESYQWHEGLDLTGLASGKARRMWKRTRVYFGIPPGTHEVGVQCRTDAGTLSVGRTGVTSLWIAREFLKPNKVAQQVLLTGTPIACADNMTKLQGSGLKFTLSGKPVEVTVSLPVGYAGGHAGCLEWMDDKPISPQYVNKRWYAGLEVVAKGWAMWHHTRTYSGLQAGEHTFSIRCYCDAGTVFGGYDKIASVLIVKEIDEARFPSGQYVDAYNNGWAIANGPAKTFTPAMGWALKFNVTRGAVDVDVHTDHYNVPLDGFITCRPTIDGKWAGAYSGQTFDSDQEEGSQREAYDAVGTYGMWHRRRIYSGIPPGEHIFGMECLGSGKGWYLGNYGVGTLLVRNVDLVADD